VLLFKKKYIYASSYLFSSNTKFLTLHLHFS